MNATGARVLLISVGFENCVCTPDNVYAHLTMCVCTHMDLFMNTRMCYFATLVGASGRPANITEWRGTDEPHLERL